MFRKQRAGTTEDGLQKETFRLWKPPRVLCLALYDVMRPVRVDD
jgi:hypothetical protein